MMNLNSIKSCVLIVPRSQKYCPELPCYIVSLSSGLSSFNKIKLLDLIANMRNITVVVKCLLLFCSFPSSGFIPSILVPGSNMAKKFLTSQYLLEGVALKV